MIDFRRTPYKAGQHKLSQQLLTGNYWVLRKTWYGWTIVATLPPTSKGKVLALAVWEYLHSIEK